MLARLGPEGKRSRFAVLRPRATGSKKMDVEQVVAWLRRLIYLDFRVFEEVRTNPTATIPGVVIASGAILLSGIGGWLWWLVQGYSFSGDIRVHSALLGWLLAGVLWLLAWMGMVYVMLTQIFRQRAYLEQLLRVMGLASSAMALILFMFIPGISMAIGVGALALTFGLTTYAIRTVTSADPAQVLVANALGFFVWVADLKLLASRGAGAVEPHAPGVFLFNTLASISDEILNFRPGVQ